MASSPFERGGVSFVHEGTAFGNKDRGPFHIFRPDLNIADIDEQHLPVVEIEKIGPIRFNEILDEVVEFVDIGLIRIIYRLMVLGIKILGILAFLRPAVCPDQLAIVEHAGQKSSPHRRGCSLAPRPEGLFSRPAGTGRPDRFPRQIRTRLGWLPYPSQANGLLRRQNPSAGKSPSTGPTHDGMRLRRTVRSQGKPSAPDSPTRSESKVHRRSRAI